MYLFERKNKIKQELRGRLGIEEIGVVLKRNRLRQFDHVMSCGEESEDLKDWVGNACKCKWNVQGHEADKG